MALPGIIGRNQFYFDPEDPFGDGFHFPMNNLSKQKPYDWIAHVRSILTKSEENQMVIHMEQDKVQLIRSFAEGYTAAWCSQDAASVAAFFEKNGSLSVNEDAPAVGREAITEVAQGFMTAFPDLQVFLDDLLLKDDGAIYHWTLTGTNTGPGGTGRAVRISGFEVWQIGTDGLIANSRGRFDGVEYQRQLEL